MRLFSVPMIGFALAACAGAGCGTLSGGSNRSPDSISRTGDNPDALDNPFRRPDRARNRDSRLADDPSANDSPDLRSLAKELAEYPDTAERLRVLAALRALPPSQQQAQIRVIRGQLALRQQQDQLNDERGLTAAEFELQARGRDADSGRDSRRQTPFDSAGKRRFPDSNDLSRRDAGASDDFRRDAERDDRHNSYRGDTSPDRKKTQRDDGLPSDRRSTPGNRDEVPDDNERRSNGDHRTVSEIGDLDADSRPRLSEDWNDALKRLIELTESRTNRKPQAETDEAAASRNQVYLRLLHVMSENPAKAVAIRSSDSADQEFWRELVWGVFEYLHQRPDLTRGNRSARTISQLRRAVEHLRAQADLEVRNLEFCREIDSYGRYETVPLNDRTGRVEFRPGEQVLLYAEIENYKTERNTDGHHKTRLHSTIELYSAPKGARRTFVKDFKFQPTEDSCRKYRRDYFHSYIIAMPTDLRPGNHVLKLTVKDIVGNKVGSDTVKFEVR